MHGFSRTTTAPFTTLLLLLTGCPEPSTSLDAGGDASGDVQPGDPDAFLTQLARAACDSFRACAHDDFQFESYESTDERCRAHFVERFAYLSASVAAARTVFDGGRIPACLDAIDAAVCEGAVPHEFSSWPSECRAVFSGAIADGGACESFTDCAGGFCSCARTCATLGVLGAGCASVPCGVGLRCSAAGVCEASPPPSDGHRGDACTIDDECAGLLRCAAGACRDGRDRRTRALGESCDRDDELCGQQLACDIDEGDVCVAPVAVGADCDEVLTTDFCPRGTLCHGPAGSAVCAAPPGEGQECFSANGTEICEPGLFCRFSVCEPMRRLGEACELGDECYSGGCFDGTCQLTERYLCR